MIFYLSLHFILFPQLTLSDVQPVSLYLVVRVDGHSQLQNNSARGSGYLSSQLGVGKSSLIMRYIKGEFHDNYHVTVGV